MPQNYVPIFIFIAIVGALLPITLLAAKLVRPSNPSKTKLMPYECGIDPIDDAPRTLYGALLHHRDPLRGIRC